LFEKQITNKYNIDEYFNLLAPKLSQNLSHDKHYFEEFKKYSQNKNNDLLLLKKAIRLRIKISFRSILELPHKKYPYEINYTNVITYYNKFRKQYNEIFKNLCDEMKITFKKSDKKTQKYTIENLESMYGKDFIKNIVNIPQSPNQKIKLDMRQSDDKLKQKQEY